MAVDVCGHLDVRVADPLLHVLQTVALRQQHAGAGVAQVVEPDMGQVVLLQQFVEGVTHIVGGVGVPVLPCEYVVVVYVILAEVVAVVLLLLKQNLEQPHRIVCQGKAAETGCVLRLVLLHDFVTRATVCRMVSVCIAKLMLSHFRPSTSLRRRPYSAVT